MNSSPLLFPSSWSDSPSSGRGSARQRRPSGVHATDRFEVRRRIGAGGMGVVYEALDRERNQIVALKTLKYCDAQTLRQFKREFRMLQDLEHPNLVSLGELFEVDMQWFFSMEFVEGVDLRSYVRPRLAQGTSEAFLPTTRAGDVAVPPTPVPACGFDERRLRRALAGLASGIAAIHSAGKVHRDIKPSNVLVTPDQRVVLLDFGLVTDASSSARSTGNIIAGTASYMAPEHGELRRVGPAADWYSLGVVLYEALTGRLPHKGETSLEVLLAKQTEPPLAPRAWAPRAPQDLNGLCMALLQVDPAARPTGDEVCALLGATRARRRRPAWVQPGLTTAKPGPFVGRDQEMARLRELFVASRERPALMVVEGESGVGKSRLLERFAELMQQEHDDLVVLTGRCYERESVPYKALDGIADSLSQYLARLSPERVAPLLPAEAAHLRRLFQAFERVESIVRAPEVPEVDDPHEQRRRMFGALRELLSRLARRHPVVLIIDDLQWTDPDSVHLLWNLVSYADPPAMLVLATSRPVEDPARCRELARMYELTGASRVTLAELSPNDAAALTRSLLPGVSPAFAAELARESGGHPQFVQELVRVASSPTGRVGANLDDALWARICALPRAVASVLEAVCVAGRPTSQHAIGGAVRRDFGELSKQLAQLRAAQLVRTNGVRRTDTVVCYHDRVRELVLRKLDARQQRRWHARLAKSLQRAGAAKTDPHALVLHAEAAGDLRRAAEYARAAAFHAIEAAAFDKAAEFFGIALRLGRFNRARDRRAVELQLAHALGSAGRGPEAAAMFQAAAQGADVATRMECRRLAAEQWLVTGHVRRGLEAVSESLIEIGEPLPTTPRRALMSLLRNRVRLRLGGMRWIERDESEIAPATLTRLDILRTLAHNLATVDPIRGADYNARFLRQALAAGEPSRVAFAMSIESAFAAGQGWRSRRRAQRLADEVRRIADSRPENLLLTAWATATEGWCSHLLGEFKRAEEALARAIVMFRGLERTTFELNNCNLWRMYTLCYLGDFNELRPAYIECLHDAQQRGDRFVETTLRRCVGRFVRLAADDVAGARSELARAVWEPPEGAFHAQHWFDLESLCDISVYEGSVDEHVDAFAAEFEQVERSMLPRIQVVRARVAWARARLALASSASPEDVVSRVRKLARSLHRERIGYAEVTANLIDAAVALRGRGGDREQAIARLRAAISGAAAADMMLHRAAAQRRLAGLVGGQAGEVLLAESDAWMASQGIANPEAMTRMIAPGF